MTNFLMILVLLGSIALAIYEGVSFIKYLKSRKRAKSNKEVNQS